MADYATTRDRVETYFDRTATKAWERLTSDAPVSRIRQTVREGRDRMRALMLSRLPADLRGARVLDAGCGTGTMTEELARRGAKVVAADISPRLVQIAHDRLATALRQQVTFHAGDMTDPALGVFDAVMAMDSLIYYTAQDIASTLGSLGKRADQVVFTVAPRTPLLMIMWQAGKLFPRSDRSPVMIPHGLKDLTRAAGPGLSRVGRVARGFYISDCLEYVP
ncbi:magnesium protoporphyrin IX methyltransferase [Tabrizicola sp. YIM 78059]|uniref:magnesium protoporphyrin IX methyltransferase n=1 Tax=Tabrizicola sp. YIM 78059 TaxID=2529861 RepID=UPI0010AA99AD|nr:magnesium protoporphyrin IX methyltransferase [Tabrizicola sp. YIM 78059]